MISDSTQLRYEKMTFSEYLKEKFGFNEPIYIGQIQYNNFSRSWIFRELKKLVDSGELKRFDRGIYFFPILREWGETTLDPYKIVYPRFITDGNEVYGYISGLSLWNKSGLSTQVPNLLEITTNKESSRVRDIYIGWARVRARKSPTTITKENEKTLQFLDLMNVMQSPKSIDEMEYFMLKRYANQIKELGVTKELLLYYSKFFPARAKEQLYESGAIYEFEPKMDKAMKAKQKALIAQYKANIPFF